MILYNTCSVREQAENRVWSNVGLPAILLPSTSPAHASLNFERKLEAWGAAKHALQ